MVECVPQRAELQGRAGHIPPHEDGRYICLSVCVSVSICLSVRNEPSYKATYHLMKMEGESVCLCVCVSVCLSALSYKAVQDTYHLMKMEGTFVCLSVCVCVSVNVCVSVCSQQAELQGGAGHISPDEDGRYICLSVCLSVCMHVCVHVCLCVSVCVCKCRCVCLSALSYKAVQDTYHLMKMEVSTCAHVCVCVSVSLIKLSYLPLQESVESSCSVCLSLCTGFATTQQLNLGLWLPVTLDLSLPSLSHTLSKMQEGNMLSLFSLFLFGQR